MVAWPRESRAGSGIHLACLHIRRLDLEHTFRFLKQTLGWTTLRVRHPEQADRWTWLVMGAFTQLGLARAGVADLRLPWERRYDPGCLTPIRVLAVSFRRFWRNSALQRSRRNPVEDHPEDPEVASLAGPNATRPSKRAPESAKTANEEFCDEFMSIAKFLVVKTRA